MPDPLSPAGEDRRAEILRLAQAEAGRRRRRRQTLRAAAAGVVVLLLTVMLTHRRPPPRPAQPIAIVLPPTTRPVVAVTRPAVAVLPPKPRQVVIQFIKTEPNLARRMAVPPQKPSWRRLDDDQLMKELADAGHPAGLAWVDGREFVLFRPPNAGSEGHSHEGKIAPFR